MTDLREGELLDILPDAAKGQLEIKCISRALKVMFVKMLNMADSIRVTSHLEDVPDDILDVLAVENRAPYYATDLPRETKLAILARTLVWHYHAGTPSVVNELMEVVFDEGQVVEWPAFEDPTDCEYLFDLVTGAPVRTETRAQVLTMLKRVKNVRSWLRDLIYVRTIEAPLGYATNLQSIYQNESAHGKKLERDFEGYLALAAYLETVKHRYSDHGVNRSRDMSASYGLAASVSKIDHATNALSAKGQRNAQASVGLAASVLDIKQSANTSRASAKRDIDLTAGLVAKAQSIPRSDNATGKHRVVDVDCTLTVSCNVNTVKRRWTYTGRDTATDTTAPMPVASYTSSVVIRTNEGT